MSSTSSRKEKIGERMEREMFGENRWIKRRKFKTNVSYFLRKCSEKIDG